MADTKQTFTDNRLKNLTPDPSGKRLILFDEKQPGLALQLTKTGTKTFQFRHWDRHRRKTQILSLGHYPGVPLAQARDHAAALLAKLNDGVDVQDEARQSKHEDTLDILFERWLKVYAKVHKRSWMEDERRYNLYLRKPLGKKQLSWFSTEKVRAWHQGITVMQKQKGPDGSTVAPATANRALALLSTIFNVMTPDISNPCSGVRKFREESRDRFLSAAEMQRFFSAIEDITTPVDTRDFLLIALFTGGRRSNVLAMKWNDIDFHREVWTIPAKESKNGRPMDIPLIPRVIEMLNRRKANASSIFVFPGKGKTGHLLEPRKGWLTILRRAELTGLRLHDLRRSCGSWMAIGGVNLPTISKALGHQHQGTTAVYSRVDVDPVRAAMEKAADLMEASKELPEKVVRIGGWK